MSAPGQIVPRPAVAADYEPLTLLFESRWHDAHGHCTPPELVAARTRAHFHARLLEFGDGLRVIGPEGAPEGFAAVKGDHVDQLYVSRALAGTGAALVLLREAEARIAAAGHDEAVLDCNPGNARAAAFYRKSGWSPRGLEKVLLDTATGPFPFEVLVFTRRVAPD